MTHPIHQRLDLWLFTPEYLNSSETHFIQNHLEHCNQCRIYVESLRSFNAHLQTHLTGTPTKRDAEEAEKIGIALIKTTPKSSFYRVAAIIACAALAGVAYYIVFNESREQQITEKVEIQEKPNNHSFQKSTAKQQLIADKFSPSAHLDDLVQTQFRSVAINAISPAINETTTSPISFRWDGTSQPLLLSILTNKEKRIFSTPVKTTFYTLQEKLQPGLYYWKLEDETDLLFTGKFIVRK
ncbi:MAG: hypothetical protein AB1728_11070 [Bacteroidota bacterium]